jgi:hypothetical protein
MRRLCPWFGVVVLSAMLMAAGPVAGNATIVEGVINDDYQLVTDDKEVYELSADEEHEAIMDKLSEEVGKRVRVKGKTETNSYNEQIIDVLSYEIVGTKSIEA